MAAQPQGIFYTTCPYNCWPVNCGLRVEVRGGEVVTLEGNPHHDLSRGMLCIKGQSCGEILRSEARLTTPLIRDGERGQGRWREAGWDEVLDLIAERMHANIEACKREANALYHSHGNIVHRINWKILTPRFANLVGMTLWDGDFPCWYDVGVAQELTGFYGLHDPPEMGAISQALVSWAQDPAASMANMMPYVTQLRERGGVVATIDPRVTQTAAMSDLHIRPRLGSDVWLANAVANILIREGAVDLDFVENSCSGWERYAEHVGRFDPVEAASMCEIPLEQIEALAGLYAEKKPLCTNLTRGALGKHLNGVQMVRSVLCLIAVSGNCGVRGGGAIWGEALDWNYELCAKERRPEAPYSPNNFNAIDAALQEGRIDTLLVVGGNPLSQWPDVNRIRTALQRLGLVVVFDLFLNHTAREVGDIVLPATSWLEELGLRTSNRRIYLMQKALEPPDECREASWWMDRLAKRLGIDDYFPWADKEECLDECLRSPACHTATVAALRDHPEGIAGDIPEVPYADGKFGSPSGQFALYSERAEELGLPPLPEHVEPYESRRSTPDRAVRFPLQLISARRNTHFHSFHDSHRHIPTLQAMEGGPLLQIHPADAAARRIADGDEVMVFNDRGRGKVRAEVTTEVPKGSVSLNDAWPELNVLTPPLAACDPAVTEALGMGGQPVYQNTLVEVRRAN